MYDFSCQNCADTPNIHVTHVVGKFTTIWIFPFPVDPLIQLNSYSNTPAVPWALHSEIQILNFESILFLLGFKLLHCNEIAVVSFAVDWWLSNYLRAVIKIFLTKLPIVFVILHSTISFIKGGVNLVHKKFYSVFLNVKKYDIRSYFHACNSLQEPEFNANNATIQKTRRDWYYSPLSKYRVKEDQLQNYHPFHIVSTSP